MFNSWENLLHTLTIGSLAYIILVGLLRISGKRTLSKWNAFDLIVTVAFGSILATTFLSTDTSLLQGLLGFSLLVLYQFIISWLSVHFQPIQKLVKAQPTLLLYRGQFQHRFLQQERVTQGEVRAAVRANGNGALENVAAVILETDGSFSVIETLDASTSALCDVRGYSQVTDISARSAPISNL
ncbi:MAG: DUF421 domain-containing protein [Cyanobacteriota bacterium]|nr:DUF421 domain-containing protein [Cyanobacteriota bacterium]